MIVYTALQKLIQVDVANTEVLDRGMWGRKKDSVWLFFDVV